MLKKLLSYEIRATALTFLPLFAALLGMALVHTIISQLAPDRQGAPEVISMILYVFILVGMFVMTMVVMIQRFFKNLLSDEGYLMFTLPVKPWKHIVSKMLVSVMWIVLSSITAILSIMIIAFETVLTPSFWRYAGDALSFVFANEGAPLFVLLFLLSLVIGLFSGILMIYASIAIGHLARSHRGLAAVGAYFLLSTVSQILSLLLGFLPGGFGSLMGSDRTPGLNMPGGFGMSGLGLLRGMQSLPELMPVLHTAMLQTLVFTALISAAYYAITHVILTKRLNLD